MRGSHSPFVLMLSLLACVRQQKRSAHDTHNSTEEKIFSASKISLLPRNHYQSSSTSQQLDALDTAKAIFLPPDGSLQEHTRFPSRIGTRSEGPTPLFMLTRCFFVVVHQPASSSTPRRSSPVSSSPEQLNLADRTTPEDLLPPGYGFCSMPLACSATIFPSIQASRLCTLVACHNFQLIPPFLNLTG